MTNLTPEAKSHLSGTIRALRERLLRDIRAAAEQDYRLSVKAREAGLGESARIRRRRLEEWLDERVRSTSPKNDKARDEARERFLHQAVKETAATMLNRLVLLRHMEALELVRPPVVTGGWNSKGYREFREFAPALLGDDTEGYGYLLSLVFDELALDLPGLFGDVGVTRLFRVPASTLREVVERLDADELESAWTDDTTLGWVYQYWNDPEREALDAKINDGGKVEPHEIASKTQMFTERYMVEWLLHNSLGLTWLAMCKKHEWTPDAEQVLGDLEKRRAVWRDRRDKGEVELDALMPINEGIEDRWKYYVPQPIPDDAVTSAPETIRDLKLLDPACGSGHFLVIAFDLLTELYREEARHRGETWSDVEIAESILENNLFGVDIDSRAIQIAAAGLYLKAKQLCRDTRIRRLNLVAPALNLAHLPDDDPALVKLVREVREETGIPEELTRKLVSALAGVDHLGTLLKVDVAVDEAIRDYESAYGKGSQLSLDSKPDSSLPSQGRVPVGREGVAGTRATLLAKLEEFLSRHEGEEDLGLRLDGEQLAAGVRFVRIVREDTYDIVVGNPPYLGESNAQDSGYVRHNYLSGKADLYTVFLERSSLLARASGIYSLVTMRGWMFLMEKVFQTYRADVLARDTVLAIGDLDRGAFEEIAAGPGGVAVAMSVFLKKHLSKHVGVAIRAFVPGDIGGAGITDRRRSMLLSHSTRYDLDTDALSSVVGRPLLYWWSSSFLAEYQRANKIGDETEVRQGMATSNNPRYLRFFWEVPHCKLHLSPPSRTDLRKPQEPWVPYIKGAKQREWFEPLIDVVQWAGNGLQNKVMHEIRYSSYSKRIPSESFFFLPAVTYSGIGADFCARSNRFRSIFDVVGSSVFPSDVPNTTCLLNSRRGREILQDLNPSVHFQVGDVERVPLFQVPDATATCGHLERAFSEHEAARENSVEFKRPGPSPWRDAQDWAQTAVDRPEGEPLPPYEPEYDDPLPEQFVSFGVGVALGRFGPNGEGILDETKNEHRGLIDRTLPGGILFLSDVTEHDSLDHGACGLLKAMWAEHGAAISPKDDLRSYLRKVYFDYHRGLYENRPIYFPLSSAKKTFVAYVSIHRWRSDTLQTLLAEHLVPERRHLEGELDDLRQARAGGSATNKTERRFDTVKKALAELEDFITAVTEIADKGPPPTDAKCPEREVDARFEMDLDDGVMVNSSALWPLLLPQWKKPKAWWKELCLAKGKKDYDWSHLAARYFPTRVDAKCKEDPSLGVAHGCFWKYHPAKAYQWELRLKDEIGPDFTIDEDGSDEYRAMFVDDHPDLVKELVDKETKRREAKARKEAAEDDGGTGPLFDREDAEADTDEDE